MQSSSEVFTWARILVQVTIYREFRIGRESPEDGEMNEMTLPSRHRTRNSNPKV